MPRAASVRPASTSAGTRDRSMGSIPCSTGHARGGPRQRRYGESGIVSHLCPSPRSSEFVHHLATGRSPNRRIVNFPGMGVGSVATPHRGAADYDDVTPWWITGSSLSRLDAAAGHAVRDDPQKQLPLAGGPGFHARLLGPRPRLLALDVM